MEDVATPRAAAAAPARPDAGALWVVLAVYAASRVLVLVVAWVASSGEPGGFLGGLTHWDGAWYTSIVAAGYPGDVARVADDAIRMNLAFFPAYPALGGLVALLPGVSAHLGAVVAANLAGAGATAGVWWYARRRHDADVALRAAVLVAVVPASVVLSMAYAEGLMIAASAVALGALLERRWGLAGVAGAVATLSRPTAAVLVVCAAWAAAAAWRRDGDRGGLVAVVMSGAGIAGYLGWLALRTGEPLAWLAVQREGWGEQVDLGAQTLAGLGRALTAPNLVDVVDALGFVVLVVGVLLLVAQRPPAIVLLFTAGVVASPLLSLTLGPRPRFVYVAFPLLVAIAVRVRGVGLAVLAAGSAVGLAALTWLYTGTWLVTP